MELKEYLNINFPSLILKPSLYYQWNTGIHFELGNEIYQFTSEKDQINLNRFEQVYSQALSIFNDLFSLHDEIILVTNVYQYKTSKNRGQRIKVYNRYIKDKDLKFSLKHKTLPYVFGEEEDADEYSTSQFYLRCRKQDIRYTLLIKAACNEDFPLKPKLGKIAGSYYPDLFFVNVTKNLIFFIYDDRGCEVIARDKESIRSTYEKYYHLVDENCRTEINQLFK
ncbi:MULTISPECIES: DUF3885 domain-containing protein [Priestia]|uniref:DUF3885 domain-containing protein n=1 Tax=Priestia TaxID=2800373 RepID=UPI0005ED13A1|nr:MULTISPECIES: DUF3885 domain-containing protein [Priestia]KJL02901.1 hypothetical protein N178_20385 [Priestia aryabhattai B8W22]MBX4162759.1 DUF3885 domain-containing protein [Priestia megaterium]MED3898129.1 DUF3885 domain-containing protein [Priestia aryabhattai]